MNIDIQVLQAFQNMSGSGYSLARAFEQWSTGATLEQIVEQITIDRFRMGEGCLAIAQQVLASEVTTDDCYRAVISRSYYAMFQAGRGVVFHVHRQDVRDHTKLNKEVTAILGDVSGEALHQWREYRNEADYSPYPNLEGLTLHDAAHQALIIATDFLDQCRVFLHGRGVSL